MIEKTLILVKPDGVVRGLVGNVTARFEQRGLKIVGMKMIWPDKEFAKKHYREDIAEKRGETVREMLLEFIVEGPVVALVIEGVNAIDNVRKVVGSTFPDEAPVGTIRGDFAHISKDYANSNKRDVRNVVHASADQADAKIEVGLWFSDAELFEYETAHEKHVR